MHGHEKLQIQDSGHSGRKGMSLGNCQGGFNCTVNALFKKPNLGSSLVVQWLGFVAFTAVQFLVGELRSRKLRGVAKRKNNKIK